MRVYLFLKKCNINGIIAARNTVVVTIANVVEPKTNENSAGQISLSYMRRHRGQDNIQPTQR